MKTRSKMFLVAGFGFLLIVSLFVYSQVQQSRDERDSAANVQRLEKEIGPRIEAHKRDMETKKAGLWQADPGKAMLARAE